jgi:hypothetical protein
MVDVAREAVGALRSEIGAGGRRNGVSGFAPSQKSKPNPGVKERFQRLGIGAELVRQHGRCLGTVRECMEGAQRDGVEHRLGTAKGK